MSKKKTISKSSMGNILKTDGTLTQSDSEKANKLNNVLQEDVSNIPTVQYLNCDRPLGTIDISVTEVQQIRHELNTAKSMGPDNMHSMVLQKLSKTSCDPLTTIFPKLVST